MAAHTVTQHDASQAPSDTVGILLIHGFNGSLTDMAEVEMVLQKNHLLTRNILLPGHGSSVHDLVALGWPEWSAAVQREYLALKQQCDRVFLVGHSMGGSLALDLAAREDVAGVVSMCAPLNLYSWMRPLLRAAKYVTPLLPTWREDVCDRQARRTYARDVYHWTPTRPIDSLMNFLPTLRAELPQVTAPALIMISVRDHVVPARDGREIYHLIGSQEKHLVTFRRSYHVIMKDHDRDEVMAKTEAFILRHALHRNYAPF